jgi:hypothetical protein
MPARLVGKTAAQQRIQKQLDDKLYAANRELLEFAEMVCGEAARRAPVEFGDLRGSFVVIVNGEQWMHTVSDADGGVQIVHDRTDVPMAPLLTIYIGTAGCVYALRQHEELTWRHPKGGEAKFVEKAFNMYVDQLLQNLQDAVRKGGG